MRGADYFIRDLGSLNGTYIAGRGKLGRDQLYKLKDRDQVVLGGAILQFRKRLAAHDQVSRMRPGGARRREILRPMRPGIVEVGRAGGAICRRRARRRGRGRVTEKRNRDRRADESDVDRKSLQRKTRPRRQDRIGRIARAVGPAAGESSRRGSAGESSRRRRRLAPKIPTDRSAKTAELKTAAPPRRPDESAAIAGSNGRSLERAERGELRTPSGRRPVQSTRARTTRRAGARRRSRRGATEPLALDEAARREPAPDRKPSARRRKPSRARRGLPRATTARIRMKRRRSATTWARSSGACSRCR